MGHTAHHLGWPSVTGVLRAKAKEFLIGWAGKNGTRKLLAFLEAANIPRSDAEEIIDRLPDAWFKKHKLTREEFWKSHLDIQKESTDIGTAAHDEIEVYLRGGATPSSTIGKKWLEWAKSVDFRPVELERKVESVKYRYGGTFDATGYFGAEPDKLYIFDWKTSNQIDEDDYSMQLAAYAQAFWEQTGRSITSGYIVRIDKPQKVKEIKVEAKRFDNLPGEFEDFLHCLAIYKRLKRFEKRWGK